MKKEKINKNFVRLVVISIFIVLLTTSVNSAMIDSNKIENNYFFPPKNVGSMTNYYEWIDEFCNGNKIDTTGGRSYGYDIDNCIAVMKYTCPYWTDPDWTRMKPITVVNSGGGLEDYALNFIVDYDPDMDSNFDDIRFKHEGSTTNFLDYWIEDFVQSNEVSVWVRVPDLYAGTNDMYLFYGNPSAQDESDFASVFTDWEYWKENDYKISIHADNEGAWDPDVSYGDYSDGRYLVAWEEGTNIFFKQEIRATLFDSEGNEEVSDFRIFKDNAGMLQYRNENPSIAYGEDGSDKTYFVAWQHWQINKPLDATTLDIYGRLVDPSDGSLSIVIEICDADNCQSDPNVVFDSVNKQFLVVWEDARDGMNDYDIFAQLYDIDGTPIGSNERLCNDANSQCEPWVSFDPVNEQYFIVWEDGIHANNGPWRIRGGIFDESLNDIWTGTIAEPSGYPNDDIDYNFPCVCFDEDSERFLVTWNDGDISDGDWRGNVHGKVFDTSGNVKVSQFTIRSGNFVRTDIVPYLSESFFVSFDDGGTVFGRLVSSEGDLISGDVQLSASPGADADWANMALGGNKIFTVWEDERIQSYPRPDAYGNMVHLNIPDGSDITYSFDDEQQLVLEAQITSIDIEPENLERWHEFRASYEGTITFDILDKYCNIILEEVSPGQDLASINPTQYPTIKLRAHYTRPDPSDTPELDNWSVLYEGIDTAPPVTWIEDIDGEQGHNDWYISESVIVWLGSRDYPEDTGSGVNYTKYTLNGGSEHIYDEDGGLNLTTHPPDYWAIWEVNFWSVDNEGNVENKENPANKRTIKIDPKVPIATITEPQQSEGVTMPFVCKVTVEENAEMDYVEFDMEPWGEREGLPKKIYTPPYEHEFNQWPRSRPKNTKPLPGGRNIEIRAWPYDKAHTPSAPDTIWINILNWGRRSKVVTVPSFRLIFEKLNLGIAASDKLTISISGIDEVDQMKFVATKILTGAQTTVWDNDLTDGCYGIFNIPTGFYKITTFAYKAGEEIEKDVILRVFFINT